MKKLFSIIVPIFKNELNLPITIPKCIEFANSISTKWEVEIIFVNDGSPDNSFEILKNYQQKYPKYIKVVNLNKNVGQLYALMAGMSVAKGDVVGHISADLQDPIEFFSKMLNVMQEEKVKVVFGERKERLEKGLSILFANTAHKIIHKLIDKHYPIGGFDFFILHSNVVKELLAIDEKNGSLQILILWLGYPFKSIPYTRQKREIGKSSWTFSKKFKLIVDIITTNSYLPLRFISVTGLVSSFIAFLYGIFNIILWFILPEANIEVKGWTSLVVLITFFSGLILFSLGVIGEYIWRIFDYIKKRPNYIIDEILDDTEN